MKLITPVVQIRGLKFILAVGLLFLTISCSGPEEPNPVPGNPDESAATAAIITPAPATPSAVDPSPKIATPTLPTAAATQESVITPTPIEEPAITEVPTEAATDFPAPPDRDLFQLARQLLWAPDAAEVPRVVNADPVSPAQGEESKLWLIRFLSLEVYQGDFELRLVSEKANWYFEKDLNVDQATLIETASQFDEHIYPKVRQTFGEEWTPGVDNDPRLNIIHARLQGVGGYFSSSDEHPQEVYPYSNERESIYINAGVLTVGTGSYLEVLAHEFQHAVHWNNDPNEETWVNEGLAELAASVAGNPPVSVQRYLRSSGVSPVHWPLNQSNIGAYYGGASLFMHYLAEHYGPVEEIKQLVAEPQDGLKGVDAYLAKGGHGVDARQVFMDWAVANILDEDEGLYGYSELEVEASAWRGVDSYQDVDAQSLQYAVDYTELEDFDEPLWLQFSGMVETPVIPAEVDQVGCWWSQAGDSINSTLTRSVDLAGLSSAALRYQLWYEIEENWDYGYVQASLDEGKTWQILETPETSPKNPIGNGFGSGYSGSSRGWINQTVDLTPFVGNQVLLRFQYVTDDAIGGTGMCLRYISVSEAGLEVDDGHWQPEGFVRINNRVRQDYSVQAILKGAESQVLPVELDQAGYGELIINNPGDFERIVVAVIPMAPGTRQPASYTLTLGPVN